MADLAQPVTRHRCDPAVWRNDAGGVERTRERTRKDVRDVLMRETLAETRRLPATLLGQLSTRRTREAAFFGGIGGAVSNQKQTCDHVARGVRRFHHASSAHESDSTMKKRKSDSSDPFEIVRAVGLTLPHVEAATKYDGSPLLKVLGSFMAGLATHSSAEPATLVVRVDLEQRQCLLRDAPETYYVTDYFERYPVVLARLSRLDRDALHDLLSVSWRLALDKARPRHAASRFAARRYGTMPKR
jgi:hypothetical protein